MRCSANASYLIVALVRVCVLNRQPVCALPLPLSLSPPSFPRGPPLLQRILLLVLASGLMTSYPVRGGVPRTVPLLNLRP